MLFFGNNINCIPLFLRFAIAKQYSLVDSLKVLINFEDIDKDGR